MWPRLIQVFRIILFVGLAGSFLFFVPIQKSIDVVPGLDTPSVSTYLTGGQIELDAFHK
jgi:hypothetical protein